MNDALTLSWSQAQAAGRERTYRRTLAVNLGLNVILGLVLLVAPVWFAGLLGLGAAEPAAWFRLWGVALIFLAALYAAGLMLPTETRVPNLVGIGERTVTGIVCLVAGGGFLLLGLYFVLFALLLLVGYYRLFQAELATRP